MASGVAQAEAAVRSPRVLGAQSLHCDLAARQHYARMVWGVVASVVGAAAVLSIAQTILERDRAQPEKPEKPAGLPEPDKNFKSRPDGNYEAPLWQEVDAKKVFQRARRWVQK